MQMPPLTPLQLDTTFAPNPMLKMGMQALQQANSAQKAAGPQPGQPTDLAAPGMPPNAGAGLLQQLLSRQPQAGAATGGQQMGMLGRLFPGLAPQQPVMPQGDPTAGLGGLY